MGDSIAEGPALPAPSSPFTHREPMNSKTLLRSSQPAALPPRTGAPDPQPPTKGRVEAP